MQPFEIEYNEEKNELLKKTRGACFEDVISALEDDGFITILKHPKKKYQHQQILVIKINNYIHAVPFVWKNKGKMAFLKTIYRDRRLHNKYWRKK